MRQFRLLIGALIVSTAIAAPMLVGARNDDCCGENISGGCSMDVGDPCADGCQNPNFPDCCSPGVCEI